MTVRIESGSADDLPEIMPVMVDAFDPRFGEAWTAVQCMGLISMPHCRLLIARDEGVAGFALYRTILDECELMLLAVAPSVQRIGTGRALLDRVIGDAVKSGARTLHLEVRSGNPAIGLYSSAGLVEVGSRSCYYKGSNGEMFDAVTYRRLLS